MCAVASKFKRTACVNSVPLTEPLCIVDGDIVKFITAGEPVAPPMPVMVGIMVGIMVGDMLGMVVGPMLPVVFVEFVVFVGGNVKIVGVTEPVVFPETLGAVVLVVFTTGVEGLDVYEVVYSYSDGENVLVYKWGRRAREPAKRIDRRSRLATAMV